MSELALPERWVKTEISNIAEVIAGGTPSSKNPDYFCEPGTGISWLTPADLTGYEKMYISHGRRDITEAGYNSSSAKLMPKGSVVFSSRAPIGYVAIAEKDLSTNQGFKSFVIPDELSSEYLYFYLKSIKGLAESLGTGTTFKELSGRACKKLPLVMAPLAEQKVIASTLESYLTTVSQIQARLDAIPKLIEKFRQSVLNDAVSGKLLCHDDSKFKSVTVENTWKHDIIGLKHWQQYKLSEVIDFIGGSQPPKSEFINEPREGYIRLIQIRDYKTDKYKAYIPIEKARRLVNKDEIMIGRYGPPIFQILRGLEGAYNVALMKAEPKTQDLNLEFLFYYLQNYKLYNYIESASDRTAGQSGVNKKHLESYPMLLPSIDEQLKIVERVKALLAHADQIEKSVSIAKARVDNLTQSILHQAFTGQLTKEWREQNPELISGDNSAEALLAKIEAEKKASGKKGKAKK